MSFPMSATNRANNFPSSVERRNWKRQFRMLYFQIVHSLRYWLISGLIESYRLGVRYDPRATFFHLSFGLVVYGVWVMMPWPCFSPGVSFLSRVLPEFMIGATLTGIGRYCMHVDLNGVEKQRCKVSILLLICFLYLLYLSAKAQFFNLNTAIWAFAVWRCIWINRRLCKDCDKAGVV